MVYVDFLRLDCSVLIHHMYGFEWHNLRFQNINFQALYDFFYDFVFGATYITCHHLKKAKEVLV